MIAFANAKINIGLQVLAKKASGYHDIETVFYPIPLHDVIEIIPAAKTSFQASGIAIPGDHDHNLCLQAYHLLKTDFDIPEVAIYLHKNIPIGAGLGGGSSDAAHLLQLLNTQFELGISTPRLLQYAAKLGADCPFFILNKPVFASGIGDKMEAIALDLSPYHLILVHPNIHISTAEAYRNVSKSPEGKQLKERIALPITQWKQYIVNDFEAAMSQKNPEIAAIKSYLYAAGAVYAAMSGSGSTVFGLFAQQTRLGELEGKYRTFYC